MERARAYLAGMDGSIADLFPDRFVDSELGEIPEGWEVKALGDLCYRPQYGYTASATDSPAGPKFLRITDINKQSWIDWSRVPYCDASKESFSKYRLRRGDILIARMADPGHSVLIEEDREAVFASYLIRFCPVKGFHARLLQYWLRFNEYWQQVEGQAAGTTRVSLNAKVLSQFQLVVPHNPVADAFTDQIGVIRSRLIKSSTEMQDLASLRNALMLKLVSGELGVPDIGRNVARAKKT